MQACKLTNRITEELLPHALRMATSKRLWRYTRRYRDYDDVLTQVHDAVWKAVRTYEPTQGAKWTTWLLHNLFLQLRGGLRKRRRLAMESNEGLSRVADTRPDYNEEDIAAMERNALAQWNLPAWRAVDLLTPIEAAKKKRVADVTANLYSGM